METIFHAASFVSAAAVSNLISAVWQGTILALAVALCLRMLPRLSAAARSVVWMSVFLLLVLLHLLPVVGGHESPMASARVASINLDLRWSLGIALAWALLSLWRGVQLMSSAVRLHGLAGRATKMDASAEVKALLRIGKGGRAAELCTSEKVERPSVFGFFRPRILIPPDLAARLSDLEMRQVVLHEMEHLRRGDDWTNLLQKIALVLFPLNPALVWVERRLCAERELACDDRVLLSSGARRAYAICLTRLAEYRMLRRSLSLALGAWERRPELVRRVHRLLRRPSEAMSGVQCKLVTATLMVGVVLGALTLARSPKLVEFAQPSSLVLSPVAQGTGAAFTTDAPAVKLRQQEGMARMVEETAVIPEPQRTTAKAAKTVKCRLTRRIAQPKYAPDDQAWVVLSDWTYTDMPSPAIVAVKLDLQGSYAAFRTENGWLIVKI
jgi:beta-lactamase regulating signal transducer with metallopeptidase domain